MSLTANATCTPAESDYFQRDEPVANLYFVALWSTGASFTLLIQAKDKRSRFFWLPLIALVMANIFVWIDLNYSIQQIKYSDLNALTITQLVVDYFTSIALGWAYAFRLRLIVFSGVATGAIHPFWAKFVLLFFIIPATYVACDILGIIVLYDSDLAAKADGEFQTYVFGAFNVALIMNDLFMHISFCYLLLTQLKTVNDVRRRRFIFISVLLACNSIGHLAGCVYNFFNSTVGTIWLYTFWVNNTLVFLLLNKTIASTLRKGSRTESGSVHNSRHPSSPDRENIS